MEFSELLNILGGWNYGGSDFCNLLINAGGVVAIPKHGVGHRIVCQRT